MRNSVPLKMILAIDEYEGIGSSNAENGIPWDISSDLRYFSQITKNHLCVVGSSTFDFIKPIFSDCTLPNRHVMVVTRDPDSRVEQDGTGETSFIEEKMLLDVVNNLTNYPDPGFEWEGIFVIGGAYIYRKFMESDLKFDEIHVTRVLGCYDCDLKLPGFYSWLADEVVSRGMVTKAPGVFPQKGEPAFTVRSYHAK